MSTQEFVNINIICRSLIIIIGLFGNLISILVFLRKAFRNNSIGTYFIAMAIFESFMVNELIINIGKTFFNVDLADLSDAMCKITFYVPVLYASVPAWILVAFSIDNLLSMRLRSYSILKKKWFQLSLVAANVLIHILMFIYVPLYYKRVESNSTGSFSCSFENLRLNKNGTIVYLLESCFIPFVIMIITSIISIRLLIKVRSILEQLGNVDTARMKREAKFAISSLAFNFLFIILKMPLLIFYFLFAFDFSYDTYFYEISRSLFFLYTSLSFFIHFASNYQFRREFKILLF